jgi:hypothetical protein
MEAFRETRRLLAVVALGALAVAASPQIERPPRETAPNPHCKCTQELTMKDFVPVAGKSDRWLIAQFGLCNTNAMDPPTVVVDWGDNSGTQNAEIGSWRTGSPDIYGTHKYARAGTFNISVRMDTTCHYKGAGQCDYKCAAYGTRSISIK